MAVSLNAERAVFDIDLYYRVGEVRKKRTRDMKRIAEYAVRLDATIYPLSKLIYCAHCEQLAQEADNAALRSYLTGKTGNKKEARRYRHDTDRYCPSHNRSINADLLERDFLLILESLTVKPEAVPLLAQAVEHFNRHNQQGDRRTGIQAEIAHWRQRAQNADTLFKNARISEEEWRKSLETSEHEIARLQFQIVQHTEAEVVLKLTMDMVADLVQNWNEANNEMRRSLASGLFEYLVYDLDKQQIVDFKLKPWIELLMQLKITLRNNDTDSSSPDSGSSTTGKQGVLCCSRRDSNPRRQVPKTCALSPELRERTSELVVYRILLTCQGRFSIETRINTLLVSSRFAIFRHFDTHASLIYPATRAISWRQAHDLTE